MERNALLLAVEADLFHFSDLLTGLGIGVYKAVNSLAQQKILHNDLLDILGLYETVEHILGEDTDKGPLRAKAEAANNADLYLVLQMAFLYVFFELFLDLHSAAGDAAGAAAEHYIALAVAAVELSVEFGSIFGNFGAKFVTGFEHQLAPPLFLYSAIMPAMSLTLTRA